MTNLFQISLVKKLAFAFSCAFLVVQVQAKEVDRVLSIYAGVGQTSDTIFYTSELASNGSVNSTTSREMTFDASSLTVLAYGARQDDAMFNFELYHGEGSVSGSSEERNLLGLFYSGYWISNVPYIGQEKLSAFVGAGVGYVQTKFSDDSVEILKDRGISGKLSVGLGYKLNQRFRANLLAEWVYIDESIDKVEADSNANTSTRFVLDESTMPVLMLGVAYVF